MSCKVYKSLAYRQTSMYLPYIDRNKVPNDPMAHLLHRHFYGVSLAKDFIKAHVFLNLALGHLVLFSSDENLEDIEHPTPQITKRFCTFINQRARASTCLVSWGSCFALPYSQSCLHPSVSGLMVRDGEVLVIQTEK